LQCVENECCDFSFDAEVAHCVADERTATQQCGYGTQMLVTKKAIKKPQMIEALILFCRTLDAFFKTVVVFSQLDQ
jgi:hypothetical protein